MSATSRIVAAAAAFMLVGSLAAGAQEAVIAKVNGKTITEADIRLAEAEIGGELGVPARRHQAPGAGRVPDREPAVRRRCREPEAGHRSGIRRAHAVLAAALAARPVLRQDRQGQRQRCGSQEVLRRQVGGAKVEDEVRARHILVESKEKARELFEKVAYGTDFAELAKQNSKDPGSKDQGGDLGYFSRGQMVPQFEEAAFKLQKGEVSQPFETQFGWHILKVDDRRAGQVAPFDAVKDRIVGAIIHQKAQQVAADLRAKAKIEYIDPNMQTPLDLGQEEVAPGTSPAGEGDERWPNPRQRSRRSRRRGCRICRWCRACGWRPARPASATRTAPT